MYYWNVALSEHCEEVPLECGSVHWNTEEVCEVAPFTQCHCWDEEAAQFRQERELQKVASQQIVRQPLVVAYSELLGPVSQQSASQQRQPFLSRHRA